MMVVAFFGESEICAHSQDDHDHEIPNSTVLNFVKVIIDKP